MGLKEYIKTLCKEKGVSLKQFASDCGLSKNYIYTLDDYRPRVETANHIAEYFGVTLDSLMQHAKKLGTGRMWNNNGMSIGIKVSTLKQRTIQQCLNCKRPKCNGCPKSEGRWKKNE